MLGPRGKMRNVYSALVFLLSFVVVYLDLHQVFGRGMFSLILYLYVYWLMKHLRTPSHQSDDTNFRWIVLPMLGGIMLSIFVFVLWR